MGFTFKENKPHNPMNKTAKTKSRFFRLTIELINFEIYLCDKCGYIVLINDALSLSKATNHAFNCVCNKEIVKELIENTDDPLKKKNKIKNKL